MLAAFVLLPLASLGATSLYRGPVIVRAEEGAEKVQMSI